jgi:cell division protein FtsW
MARFRRTPAVAAGALQHEHQGTIFERLDRITRLAESYDPQRSAQGVFFAVLALMGLGFVVQVSHAATTVRPQDFGQEILHLLKFRLLGLGILLLAYRIGPHGVRPFIAHLTGLAIVLLIAVYLPVINAETNGSRRWIDIPLTGLTLQPSEIARVVIVLWVAARCIQLGPLVRDGRRGYLPMLAFGMALFLLILGEPDFGGALLFLLCFVCTMWVGGARPAHVAGSIGFLGGGALVLGVTMFTHVRERLALWLGDGTNLQVMHAVDAIASGDMLGVGFAQGEWRNSSLQYMQTDYVFSLVGEELGYLGLLLIVGLLMAYLWHSVRLVLSLRDRYCALVAFGLLVSVALQAMLHVQVVTGLAPPKGMNLPFLSDGGSSLVASCLAVGLALGAARRPSNGGAATP